MSVKILLYTLLKQIGIFLVVSFLVFRGTFVESDSLGLNLSTGVSLLLSVILWGIINLHTYWLIPGYLFQRRYKKYIIYLSCLVGFMLTAMVGAICFLGQYYVIPEQMQRLNSDLPFFLLINALALILYFLAFSFTIFLHRWVAYQQRLNELENISIQTDLNHLKDQLQPEFFSRILNKVRTLLGEDGEKASLLIFKLSRLLRYQLYESERQQVLLGDDIDFMTDYMKLEKLCNPEFNFEVSALYTSSSFIVYACDRICDSDNCMWREWKGRKYKDRFSNGRESASIHLYILSAKKGKSASSTCF